MAKNNTAVSEVAARNIKLGIVDQKLTTNALATKARIPRTTFDRNLSEPERFTLKQLGNIAEALDIQFEDLFKGAA
jgi:DNA-binding phage protein